MNNDETLARISLVAIFSLVTASCAKTDTESAAVVADTVYTNGRIYTVNGAQRWADAVAIKDGKYIAVGSADDVAALTGDGTEVVDLAGAFAMPGLQLKAMAIIAR